MSCSHVTGCQMFPLFTKQALLRVWQINYCEGDHARCARFRLSKDGRDVPPTLLPNGQHLSFALKSGT